MKIVHTVFIVVCLITLFLLVIIVVVFSIKRNIEDSTIVLSIDNDAAIVSSYVDFLFGSSDKSHDEKHGKLDKIYTKELSFSSDRWWCTAIDKLDTSKLSTLNKMVNTIKFYSFHWMIVKYLNHTRIHRIKDPIHIHHYFDDGCVYTGRKLVLSHSRPVGNRSVTLWPLWGYQYSTDNCMGGNIHRKDTSWDKKLPVAVWRGVSTGRWPHSKGTKASRMQLVRVVKNMKRPELADVGFTNIVQKEDALPEELSEIQGYVKKYMSQRKLLRYKYIIVVEGNDLASGLPWNLSSQSVVMTPPFTVESLVVDPSRLLPWVHFVPIRSDFLDLEEKLEWCLSHDDDCKRIVNNANSYMESVRRLQKLSLIQLTKRIVEYAHR